MRALDAILFGVLLLGNVLALPLWWWLFGAPLVRLSGKRRASTRPRHRNFANPSGTSTLKWEGKVAPAGNRLERSAYPASA